MQDNQIRLVCAVYYSPTGNTQQVTCEAAQILADCLKVPLEVRSLTLPEQQNEKLQFAADDLVVLGFPTYAGKLPNKILPDLKAQIHGTDTRAVALVTFGNRSFDNALAELCAVMSGNGFQVIGAAAVPAEHAFLASTAYQALAKGKRGICLKGAIGAGLPDDQDLQKLKEFAVTIGKQIGCRKQIGRGKPDVPGDPAAPYYTPLGADGQPAKFLKAVPETDSAVCTRCGHCAAVCPMGSIDPDDPAQITGVCIKCQACVRSCPARAKYFTDPAFLSHVRMLEMTFAECKAKLRLF